MKSNGSWDSAAEARQQKLLEYLAAKGKLKPPNPKPYLRDRTNCLPSAQAQPTKVGAVVLQKENLHNNPAKTKARLVVLPGRPPDPPLHTSNVTASDRLRNVSQKPHSTAGPYSRPSQSKVTCRISSRMHERVGSSTTLRHSRNVVDSPKQVVEKLPKLLKNPVCVVSTVSEAWEPSHDGQAMKVFEVQSLESCSDLAIYKCLRSGNKAKAELDKKSTVSQNPNRRKNAICTNPPSKYARNATASTTSGNVAACAYMKSNDAGKTSKVMAHTKLCGKTAPRIPLSKKDRKDVASSSLLPKKGKLQSKPAILKSSVSVAKAGISTSGKSMNSIQAKMASMVKLQEHTTAPPRVVKNFESATQKSKSRPGMIGCLPNKSKDTVLHRHTEDNSATTVRSRAQNRRPMFYTPGPVSAPAFPRNAVTEVKVVQYGRRATSSEEILRSKLNEWMKSKGKAYKRLPMTLPTKKSVKKKPRLSFWAGIEEEDELKCLADNIAMALSECLRLIEEGFPTETVETILSKIPHCEKFAKYWICKAKLQERCGTFDMIGLYEQAVRVVATPIEELRETIFNIMKNINQKPKAVKLCPLPDEKTSVPPETVVNKEQSSEVLDVLPYHNDTRDKGHSCPNILTRQWIDEQGSALKFKITQFSRVKEPAVVRDWKMLTPVRRSLRIQRAVTFYPETLREHDTVVSSLNDLLDTEDNDCFIYRENEALPKEIDSKIRAL